MAFTHLPADIAAALEKYSADIDSGKITFGTGEFAQAYPGQQETDSQVAGFIASHVAE